MPHERDANRNSRALQFPLDVATYATICNELLAADIKTAPPEATTLYETIDANPLSASYMMHRTLRDRGYGIHFITRSQNESEPNKQTVEVHVDEIDAAAVEIIMHRIREYGGRTPYQPILQKMLGRVGISHLNPDRAGYRSFKYIVNKAHSYDQFDGLLLRTFLTSRIIAEMKADSLFKSTRKDYEMYELLRKKGIQPFSKNELYSMAGKVTARIVDNSEIPLPATDKRS